MQICGFCREIAVRIIATIVVLLVSACAQIPEAELKAYTDAVTAAKTSGETLITNWQAAKAESDRRAAVANPPPDASFNNAISLEWQSAVEAENPLTAAQVRLLAWEAIAEYTTILARLNAGESVETVKSSAGRLFELGTKIAGGAFPGAGSILEIVKKLAAQIEKARLAAEFTKAVKAGAPILRRVITDGFIADIANHYSLRATLAEEDRAAVELESDLSVEEKRLKQQRILDEIASLKGALDAYEILLVRMNASITDLENAVDKPIEFSVEANRILDIAFTFKQHWTAYENARREARK